jgi:hypothetical protein
MTETKKCSQCKNVKSIDDFNFVSGSRTIRRPECRFCARERCKKYYRLHKEKIDKQNKEYAAMHKKETKQYKHDYYQENKEDINQQFIERKHDDINFRIACNLRNRLYSALKNNRKEGSAVNDLGCSIEFFKIYLELKFYPNPETGEQMTWENYGAWHIDHIIPLTLFNLTDGEQLKMAVYYTNLQPLWALDNLKKSDFIEVDGNIIRAGQYRG